MRVYPAAVAGAVVGLAATAPLVAKTWRWATHGDHPIMRPMLMSYGLGLPGLAVTDAALGALEFGNLRGAGKFAAGAIAAGAAAFGLAGVALFYKAAWNGATRNRG